jgi:hypothetical protein
MHRTSRREDDGTSLILACAGNEIVPNKVMHPVVKKRDDFLETFDARPGLPMDL